MSASNALALNDAQQRAVDHGRGSHAPAPLLVIAGAGTGKTQTIAHRVARLVAEGADPQRLLLLTFSRRAAATLERRAGRALHALRGAAAGAAPPTLPWAGTFHSVGARLLREYADAIGLPRDFTVHDRGDAEDLMGLVRARHVGEDATRTRFPGAATLVAIYSTTVNAERPLADVLAASYPWCAASEPRLAPLFADYVATKQAQHVLDFDDLLLWWATMMGVPALAEDVGRRFDHVLVDEYQDTNALQATIVRRLKPDGRGVTVVGDDAQAIYGFRAATVRNILDFPRQYDPPAAIVTLERNYRSTQGILDASNAVIADARERHAKTLAGVRGQGARPRLVTVEDEAKQAQFVAERVLAERENGVALKRQAVLFRTSAHSALLELELARRDIPYVKFGGLRFQDAAHVKDVLSLMRWIANPRERIAGFRVLRMLPGVGPRIAMRCLDVLDAAPDPTAALAALALPRAADESWVALRALCTRLRESSDWPADAEAVVEWFLREIERLYEDAALRMPDLAQLRRIAAAYPSRERFLTELALDPPSVTSAESDAAHLDDDWLTLSTIHSAKGQEWNVVHVLNCVDGCVPSDLSVGSTEGVEEERRLLYVAMTRAKDTLSLVLPQRFYVRQQGSAGDRHVYASRSRFLTESVCRAFDAVTWPDAREAAPPGSALRPATTARVDLAAAIRGAWAAR